MIRWLFALSFALLTVSPSPAAEPPKIDVPALEAITEKTRKNWSVPGVGLVVVQGEQTVLAKGFGHKQHDQDAPITAKTVFPLGSCTKAFTSALMAAMVDDGKLAWDDSVRKHLPSFHISDEAADKLICLRDLLTHRSGLGGHDLIWYHAPWDQAEVLKRIPKIPLTAPFRGGYQYTSLTFTVAGAAMANTGAASWDTLLDEKICTPLGMKSVAFKTADAKKLPDRAAGHKLDKNGKVIPMAEYNNREPDAAGTLYTSVEDLAAWLKLHLNDGKLDGKQIISAKNLAETRVPHTPMRLEGQVMLSTYPETTQVSYAMGWVVFDYRGQLVISHGGMIDGFRTQITLLPKKKIGFALMNNLHETRMNQGLTYSIIDQLLGLPAKDWDKHFMDANAEEAQEKREAKKKRNEARDPDIKPSLPLEKFTGEYHEAAYGTGRVELKDGKLTWVWSSFRCPLEHWSSNTFRITEGYFEDELVEFAVSGQKVVAASHRGIPFKR